MSRTTLDRRTFLRYGVVVTGAAAASTALSGAWARPASAAAAPVRVCLVVIDGLRLDDARFVAAWDDVAPYVQIVDDSSVAEGGPRLSFFEVLTVMAFAVFADAPVDVAVVEVGLGGLWDSTNVVDGVVAVVTPVALDHERWLGHDLTAITEQKAGIVKEHAIMVMAQQDLTVAEVLMARAAATGAVVAR